MPSENDTCTPDFPKADREEVVTILCDGPSDRVRTVNLTKAKGLWDWGVRQRWIPGGADVNLTHKRWGVILRTRQRAWRV